MVQIGSRSPLGDAEHRTDLAMSESFDIVQDDHGALPVGEAGERLAPAS